MERLESHLDTSSAEFRGYPAAIVDGVVYVTGRKLRPGRMVRSEIVAAQGYDLIAAAVGKPR
mgnify:CR=1 FL=1